MHFIPIDVFAIASQNGRGGSVKERELKSSILGGKYSNFEGGTRVPFVVHWPAKVKPGVSSALISQVDLLRSLAKLTGGQPAGPDSEDVLPALLGQSQKGRQFLVEQSNGLSLRDGNWKYIPPGKGQKVAAFTNTETGIDPEPQLYDLATDLGETNNLATANPGRLKSMVDKQGDITLKR